ncbi:hypothetical protein BC830DRAFT_1126318 [Chytriomyces sp. MP71]|nr:hypothetical protein BC830DRAFT_1126318 [Chytriomyces sp. MP71]
MSELEASLDRFVAANQASLAASGMPRQLWASIWGRIEASKFGSRSPIAEEEVRHIFDVAVMRPKKHDESGNPVDEADLDEIPCIIAAQALIPRAAVVVFQHEWTFENSDQARQHLEATPSLITQVVSLFTAVNALAGVASDERMHSAPIQYILENLHRIAFSFQVATATDSGATKTYHYVILDPFSPAVIPVSPSGKPVLSAFLFVDQRNGRPYTVMYPGWIKQNAEGLFDAESEEEDTIPPGTVITRSPLPSLLS